METLMLGISGGGGCEWCRTVPILSKTKEYYMGKNTMERQSFIINNLVFEEDKPEAYIEMTE